MFYRSILAFAILGVVMIVTAFPIEIKDIQFLFPPQNTLLRDAGAQTYETQIDKQLGDSEEEERKKECVPKQNAEPSTSGEDTTPSEDATSSEGFVDETPINGTIVDDPMEVKIYKPECDD